MAKALITLTWCDRHLTEKDEEVPAEPMPEWADKWQVDLCAECAVVVLEARALYEQYGAKGKRTAEVTTKPVPRRPDQAADGPYTCPQKGCGSVLVNKQSLGAHARQTHGMTVGELLGQPLKFKCDCGRGFTTGQGLAAHQRSAHGAKPATAGAGA